MKKLFGLLTVTLLLGLMTASSAHAVTEQQIGVTVTVTGAKGFNVDKTAWAIGDMGVGATKTMGEADVITVTSTGTQPQTYNLLVWDSSDWSDGTVPAANTYVMSARIQGATPAEADFVAGDIIVYGTGQSIACDGTKFGGGGKDVAPGVANKLWLQFKSPISTTVTTAQSITVKIGLQ